MWLMTFLISIFHFLVCPYYSQVLTASASYSRTLTSPNYPLRYGNSVRCKWVLKVDSNLPFGDYIVKVTFSGDFKLEGLYGDCNDKLKFYDGNSTVSTLLGTYCETIRPDVLYSTGQDLYVEFDTDRLVTYKGFSFSFSAVNKGILSLSCSLYYKMIIFTTLPSTPGHLRFFHPLHSD